MGSKSPLKGRLYTLHPLLNSPARGFNLYLGLIEAHNQQRLAFLVVIRNLHVSERL